MINNVQVFFVEKNYSVEKCLNDNDILTRKKGLKNCR
jgi:hypothetical protein